MLLSRAFSWQNRAYNANSHFEFDYIIWNLIKRYNKTFVVIILIRVLVSTYFLCILVELRLFPGIKLTAIDRIWQNIERSMYKQLPPTSQPTLMVIWYNSSALFSCFVCKCFHFLLDDDFDFYYVFRRALKRKFPPAIVDLSLSLFVISSLICKHYYYYYMYGTSSCGHSNISSLLQICLQSLILMLI